MNKKLVDRLIGLIDGLDHDIENNQIKDIFKLQKGNRDKILDRVADIALKYNVIDNKLDIPIDERAELKRRTSKLINSITKSEYKGEASIMAELLKTNAVDMYGMNTYLYDKVFTINYNLKRLPDKKIKEIINHKVKGELWSERLWRNKQGLNKQLRKELYNFMDGKVNVNEISQSISKGYGQSFGKSRTLVRTEATRVQAEVNEEWASDNGIEQQMFVATLDDRTSEECEEYDGEIYNMDDPSKPEIPVHPNCRSVLVNVPYEGWQAKTRIDNITKQNINYVDYKEWKNKQ